MNEKIKSARVTLGSFLLQRREQLGISQELLGEAVGVSANTIKGVESGRFAMDVDLQFQIYSALGIKPYFSYTDESDLENLKRNNTKADSGDFHGYYISENILLYPEQLAIVKLTYPRLFVRFNYGESFFANYKDWKANLTVQEWIDGEKPNDDEVDYILTECWNFLCLDERENEKLNNEMEDDL